MTTSQDGLLPVERECASAVIDFIMERENEDEGPGFSIDEVAEIIARHRQALASSPSGESDAPKIYVQWSEDGQYIRKWQREPFQAGSPYSVVAADERLSLVARRIVHWVEAVEDLDDDLEYLNSRDGWDDIHETAMLAREALNVTCKDDLQGAWTEADVERIHEGLQRALEMAVLTLAFHGRDRGGDRWEKTLDNLEELARKTDPIIRAALSAMSPAATEEVDHD